ncbi:MAG: STN domain-containing protein, partial [Planctomycetia bacterium]|nr:STN domain-containing protein [Planctomycetia bacterium]
VEIAAETEPVEAAPPDPAPEENVAAASTADDLLRRLQTDLAAIDEPAISLAALVELLGGLAACSIELDGASLASIGVTGESGTSVKLEDATIEAALIAALEPLGLAYEPRGKSIVIFAARN